MYLHWTGVEWTGLGAAMPDARQGLVGSTPWHTSYKIVDSKQGITARDVLKIL